MRRVVAAASLVLVALACVPASGSVTAPVEADRKVESSVLRADASTGRAWVEVTLAKRFVSGKEARARGHAVAVAVPGLVFDRATNEIALRAGERLVACGTGERIAANEGACAIDARIEEVVVDTGFGAKKTERLVVDVRAR